MNSPTFADLGLCTPIVDAVGQEGYQVPTEIQVKAIPVILARRDLLATAQTGTGKTAAFVLPLLHLLNTEEAPAAPQVAAHQNNNRSNSRDRSRGRSGGGRRNGSGGNYRGLSPRTATPEALVLAPTRELAIQIDERVSAYGNFLSLEHTAVYGGAPKPTQLQKLYRGPRVLVATPGRLLDFVQEGAIELDKVRYLVLDEADRMLDMGFIPDVRRISAMIAGSHQTALFSATMPNEIADLAASVLTNPERVEGEQGNLRIDRINHSVMYVDQGNKMQLLVDLIAREQMFRAIVFTRTKHRASRVAHALSKQNITSDAIHGDKTQSARKRALGDFRSGRIQVLVATDVASRGIDVDDISHVVNFEIPREPETYVHRVGRTARAGASGIALSLCDREEMGAFRAIERLLDERVAVDRDHAYHAELPARPAPKSGSRPRRGRPEKQWTTRSSREGGNQQGNSSSRPQSSRSAGTGPDGNRGSSGSQKGNEARNSRGSRGNSYFVDTFGSSGKGSQGKRRSSQRNKKGR